MTIHLLFVDGVVVCGKIKHVVKVRGLLAPDIRGGGV
jgi:hypothetical protein